MEPIRFTLNGREVRVAGVDPHTTLLQYLRESGLTGTKEGCAEGECGACAVALAETGPDGSPRYLAVNSCLMPLPAVANRHLLTVEGLARGDSLHPVQEAMARAGGSQCGYCTPGFVMSLFAEYYRPDRTGFDPEALSGNLCRCTGYRPIRDAARSLGSPALDDPFRAGMAIAPAGPVSYAGRFFRPERLQDLFALMDAHPGARLVAGATDLAVDMNLRGARWPVLLSLEAIPELQGCHRTARFLELGTGLTLSQLEQRLAGQVPLLDQLFPLFASRLIRNRATLGGNLATASPIGDAAPVLLALGAQVRLVSARGERQLPLEEFFTGYRRTALEPGEVMRAVRIPLPLPEQSRFYKVAKRLRDDISTVAAAFALDLDPEGRVRQVRLAYGGVGPTPTRAYRAEQALTGQLWDEAALQSAQQILAQEFQPISDHRGSALYRQRLVASLLAKFFTETKGGAACARS